MRMRADPAGAGRPAHDCAAQRTRRDAAVACALPVPLDGDGTGIGSGRAPCAPLLGCLRLDRRTVDPAARGVVRFAAVGESFALLEESSPASRAGWSRSPEPPWRFDEAFRRTAIGRRSAGSRKSTHVQAIKFSRHRRGAHPPGSKLAKARARHPGSLHPDPVLPAESGPPRNPLPARPGSGFPPLRLGAQLEVPSTTPRP